VPVDRFLKQVEITFKLSIQTADNVYQHGTFKHTMRPGRRFLPGISPAGKR